MAHQLGPMPHFGVVRETCEWSMNVWCYERSERCTVLSACTLFSSSKIWVVKIDGVCPIATHIIPESHSFSKTGYQELGYLS